MSKLSRLTIVHHAVAWYAWRAPLVISGAAQYDIAIAIYRISLSLGGNELGNAETSGVDRITKNKTSGGDVSDLICSSGQRRTNTLVVRTYADWPLRVSGVIYPLARTGLQSEKSRRASGQCRGLRTHTKHKHKYGIHT